MDSSDCILYSMVSKHKKTETKWIQGGNRGNKHTHGSHRILQNGEKILRDCSKYIERAKNNKTGSVNWTLQLEKVQELVKEFKQVHPKVKYTIEQDWDDEEDYEVTFSWEPRSFG
jgi:hypothetical protein